MHQASEQFNALSTKSLKFAKNATANMKEAAAQSGVFIGCYNVGGKEVVEIKKIADGGFASVRLVRCTSTQREFAMKKIKCSPQSQIANTVEEAEREARLLSKISHPNIVKCHSWGRREGKK